VATESGKGKQPQEEMVNLGEHIFFSNPQAVGNPDREYPKYYYTRI
jgi:hypothetical protein